MPLRKARTTVLRLLGRKAGVREPLVIRDDDVFLVSYPRSGNTWVRFLLANLLSYSEGTPVDFYSVHRFIPDLEVRDQWGLLSTLPSPRIIKSHTPHRPAFAQVIYLVRDGRDVYASYHDFLTKQGLFQGTLADLLFQADALPYGAWHTHVESWLAAGPKATLVVQDEDLLENPHHELERMAQYIGLEASAEQIDWAVEYSSFDQMHRLEVTIGRPYGVGRYRFVRRGAAGGWAEQFDERCKQMMKSTAGATLVRLGYAENMNW